MFIGLNVHFLCTVALKFYIEFILSETKYPTKFPTCMNRKVCFRLTGDLLKTSLNFWAGFKHNSNNWIYTLAVMQLAGTESNIRDRVW